MPPRRGWECGGAGCYKDFAPDGAFGRNATVSDSSRRNRMKAEGPVAAGGGTEAVENILRRGLANVLRLGLPQPRSGGGISI